MSIQIINNGDPGLKARNALNRIGEAAQISLSARTATIMGFGDSLGNTTEAGNGFLSSAIRWMRHYWEPGLDVRMLTGFNVGGVTSLDLPNQFTNYTNAGVVPDIAILSIFQNDGGSLLTDYTNRMTTVKTFVQNLLGSGVKLVIISSGFPSASLTKEIAISDLTQFVFNTPGTALCDIYSQLISPSAAQGTTGAAAWKTVNGISFTVDGTHPSLEGCKAWGRVLADILRPICRRRVPRIASNEIYSNSGTTARYANGVPPGNMNGTSGQLNGVDNTGVAGFAANADSRWNIITTNGVTVTPSIVTTADGIRRQRMALSGTVGAGGGIARLQYLPTFLPFPASAPYYGQAVMDFASVVGLSTIGGSSFSMGLDANGGTQAAMDTLTGRYFDWKFDVAQGGGGYGTREVVLNFAANATISGTIDVGQCGAWITTPYPG